MKIPLFLSVILVAAAFAGCANGTDESDGNMTTTTPATTTPAASTTPAVTTPATNGSEEEMTPLVCTGDYVTDDSNATRLGMPELSFTVKEPDAADPCYAFVGPANATAGWNVFTLQQPGMEFHIMPMYFVGERTIADVFAAFQTSEQPPEWAVPAGAVGGITGGQNGSVAIDLEEGNYVYFCPVGGHMLKGMAGMIQVAPSNETSEAPEADFEIDLVDYNFTVPQNVSAGEVVIKVTNEGSEPHEMPLALLDENTTAMEFLVAMEDPNATGPPPGALIGGVNVIAPGQTVYVLAELVAGRTYGTACFVSSPSHGGAPHLAVGPMVAEFKAA